MAFYLQSTKNKDLEFRIMKLDKVAMKATLQGTGSTTPFERSIKQEDLDRYGYVIVKKVDDAPGLPAAPAAR